VDRVTIINYLCLCLDSPEHGSTYTNVAVAVVEF
jgi:hypothetical protein